MAPPHEVKVKFCTGKEWMRPKLERFVDLLKDKLGDKAMVTVEEGEQGKVIVSLGGEIMYDKTKDKYYQPGYEGGCGGFGVPTPERLHEVTKSIGDKCGVDARWTSAELKEMLQLQQDHMKEGKQNRAIYMVDGKMYDLKDFIPMHPGGVRWFKTPHVDITAELNTYHDNPQKIRGVLKNYEINDVGYGDVPLILSPPPFLNVGAQADGGSGEVFDWDDPKCLVPTIRRRIREDKGLVERMRQADMNFDRAVKCIFIVHLLLIFPVVGYGLLPLWLVVILMTVTRTSLAACGHYHCHRAKDGTKDWGEAFFDMQYVGQHLITFLGHVIGHHVQSDRFKDPKATVFTAMLEIPRIWRIPSFTFFRFGHMLTGTFLRYVRFAIIDTDSVDEVAFTHTGTAWNKLKTAQFFFVRMLLVIEFFWCVYTGHWLFWAVQFTTTVWVNLFMIVSSHEFENPPAIRENNRDWGVFQVENAADVYITGFKYLDTFLSAGLTEHRVHHLLPNNRSGWANIVVEPLVKEVCEKEFGIKWDPPVNFWTVRVAQLARMYFTDPARYPKFLGGEKMGGDTGPEWWCFVKEHINPGPLVKTFAFTMLGFVGMGI